jgi:hypothetical protein
MKRTLAIALSTLALAATAVQAETPKPSFMDYAPLEAGDSSAGRTPIAISRLDVPQPSFIDYVAIAGDASTGGSSSVTVASQDFPAPSFVDYPEGERSSPLPARPGHLQAGTN